MRSVTGTQKVRSIVTVPGTVHSKTYMLDLRLLDASCPNLFGRDWIQSTNVSIDHIMREINKLTTVDVIHSGHGNEMLTHSDHGNGMHIYSEHGNEMQPIVKLCNDILCDENGSGSDIASIYDVVCTMYFPLIHLDKFSNRVRLTLCIMLITCHLAVVYCLNTRNYFLKSWENLPRGRLR